MEEILASIRRIIADDDETNAEAELAQDAQIEAQSDTHDNDDVEGDDAEGDNVEGGDVENDAENDEAAAQMADDEAPEENPPEDDAGLADAGIDGDDDEEVFELSEVVEEDAADEDAGDAEDDAATAMMDELADDASILEDDIAFEDQPEPEPEPAAPPAEPVGDVLLSAEAQSSASTAFGALASSMLSYSGGARTLEGIVEDLLRPLLKAWLDENLPPMVEQMVREEIERVARRR